MNSKSPILTLLTLCFAVNTVLANTQFTDFSYSRALGNQQKGWHQLELPEDINAKTKAGFADIRILGVTETGDSLEVPFLELQNFQAANKKPKANIPAFEIINQSKRKEGAYYTFKLLDEREITAFKLHFKNLNFDWLVNLEGSHNQQKWFNILEDYRILGIKNGLTNYKFTTLKFPKSDFNYYRVLIKNKTDEALVSAEIETVPERLQQKYHILNINPEKLIENNNKKQTEIFLSLPYILTAENLTIKIKNDWDFYRRISIHKLSDSIKMKDGKRAHYHSFKNTILNSWDGNVIRLSKHQKIQHLKIIIYNEDNMPLEIESISVKYPIHKLAFRLPEKAGCTLFYGNHKATKPNYDLSYFKNKIPNELPNVALGNEVNVATLSASVSKSNKIINKYFIWLFLGFTILLLAGFSLKMLRSVD